MLHVTIRAHLLTGSRSRKLCRRAVLVCAADEKDLGAGLTAKPRMHVRRQQRANEVTEVLDAVHVGNGAGHEIAGHGSHPCLRGRRALENQKSPPAGAEELGFGTSRADAHQPFRPPSLRLGRSIRRTRMSIFLHMDQGIANTMCIFNGSIVLGPCWSPMRYAAFAGGFRSFPTLPDRIASPSLPSALISRTKSRTASRARISCG